MHKLAYIFLITLLMGCEPNITIIGEIDKSKLITPKDIQKLSYDEFRQQYLGKEITLTGFTMQGINGGYSVEDGMCVLSVRVKDKNIDYELITKAYVNNWPNYVVEDAVSSNDRVDPKLFDYPEEVSIPNELGICKPTCQYSETDNQCFHQSPNLIITGKIISLYEEYSSIQRRFSMKIKGVGF